MRPTLLCTSQKRKQDSGGVLASLVEVIERAEEQASQREEKMRRIELEMEIRVRDLPTTPLSLPATKATTSTSHHTTISISRS